MRRSIRFQLVRQLGVALFVIAVLVNGALFFYLRGEIIEQYDDAIYAQAGAIAAVWESAAEPPKAAAIGRIFPGLHLGEPSGSVLQIVRADGVILLQLPAVGFVMPPLPPRHADHGRHRAVDLTLPGGRSGRAIEIAVGDAAHSRLVLAQDRDELDSTLATFAGGLAAVGGGLSVLAIGVTLVIARVALRPLSSFSDAVEKLDVHHLDFRFDTGSLADELVPIATRLNQLLRRMGDAFDRERRFTGNVAHELRTPLAELRSMLDVAIRWPLESGEWVGHEQKLLEVVVRMTEISQTLLALARADSETPPLSTRAVDLIALLNESWRTVEASAAQRGVSIAFDLQPHQLVRADAAILRSILDNLFNNAAQYATPGSCVECRVRLAPSGSSVTLDLINVAAEIVESDLPLVDEPFWRKDAARSSGEHVGLGLTLVRAYCKASNIQLQFRMPDPNRFWVQLDIPVFRDI